MKMHLSLSDTAEGVRQAKQVGRHATYKAVLLLFHTGVQLSFPSMVCLHFSVTHRSPVTPVAPPASNHRVSPLWTAWPSFQSCDSNLLQLSKMGSENSGVGGYLTGENYYNWHLTSRQTAGNLTPRTVHKKHPYGWEWLCWCGCFFFVHQKQTRQRHACLLTVTDRQAVWRADVLNPWLYEIIAADFKLSWTLAESTHLWTVMGLAYQPPHPQPAILRSSVFF